MSYVTRLRLSVVLITIVVLSCVPVTNGHFGDPQAEQAFLSAYAGEPLRAGAPDAIAAITSIVEWAAEVANEAGQGLLPPNTTVDAVLWVDNVAEIYLTVPARGDDWYLSPIDLETLSLALGRPFANDPAFAGTRVRVRTDSAGPYDTLELLLLQRPSQPPDADWPTLEPYVAGEHLPAVEPGFGMPPRGPVVQASGQPAGALSGVTVYASAGHGWTAGDSTWYLQRPVLLEMAEDYGNIDQLNYFVHYAFNAGATVVPMRPVGWQPTEIVLDNDDPGVTFTGSWADGVSSKYYENGVTISGVVYKSTSAETVETATARYTPDLPATGFYPVYCFTIASDNRTLQTYRVSHGGGISEVMIDHREVGNGWIWLGNYYLELGGDNYVEITNQSDEGGWIIADAIRWGGGLGDVVRPGPGSISGYPRDEEAQRYWGESEWGDNATGFSSSIWDLSGYSDGSDNVGTGARIAREMNIVPGGGELVDRWKRVHLEFHTNASGGGARGQLCLITDLGATTYQSEFANTLSDEVDADLLLIDQDFEHEWYDRSSATYTSSYGAIATSNNSNEFDATIVELAFHDNQDDAELLRDDRVRSVMARACVHGIIRFLNGLPGSEVPLAFAPDTPRFVRAEDLGDGDVLISWVAPLADGARGDPASGYVVYQSGNGYGFGNPIVLGDVLSTTITDVPVGTTRYYRVAATNAGGESMPSEVLAVCRPAEGTTDVLIVNGFDRLRRQINPIQTFTQPPAYAGDSIERQIWRRSNSFDYVVQHAEALAANEIGFVSCSNEAVIDYHVQLADYDIVVWILGTESEEDATFSGTEQSRVTDFLVDGGAVFVSGAEIGYDLVGQGSGASFFQDTLRVEYVADDAGTFDVTSAASGILSDIGAFDFDPANGAPYTVYSPDRLSAGSGALACLNYVGGSGGVAGVQYTGEVYNTVTFGFPFETITSPSTRADIMQRVIAFLATAPGPRPFDYDRDADVDMVDFSYLAWCFQGPDLHYPGGHFCVDVGGEEDLDIDLADFSLFQQSFTGSGP